ncbi:high-affinity branched-chain amino acid ABC transporter permease LivH [Thioalbus denitrificans]|uniref:L-leucine ABC transporter membrane protein /L-isoleucine ABC transporter membrane protein /L-valine ABC transporter membrane protein n=1 Tax=Thioalbus denitrificans TaxID=547122 RepID=A0A369CH51_9GAMM|nr:high-affinity branched-chain amino acid ABC transporter permease LivH [Thioalbus denitrificans]RCX33402.1 L-leucine ABC transporter membrane protein /L-isoleucine ABC transporter membrane protein /L-valine ABC transporter membrane protein [Thioalbus denitrificans]
MSDSLLQFSQQIINGLTLGSIYALIAIGYTMVYGIIGMINFAHGEIYMISAYVGLIVITALGMLGITPIPLVLLIALFISIIVTSAYGWTVERLAYRPLRGSERLVALISAIGMSIFLQNYMQLSQGARDVAMQPLITGGWRFGDEAGFQVYLSYMQIIIAVATVASMAALTLFIGRSRLGRACRATSEDRNMANLLGINTDRVISLTFVIGAALAAVAGVLVGLYYGVVNPFMGFIVGLKAFTAAVLGGIGSIPGAMLGGVVLGLSESFASAYLTTEYKDVVSFSLLVLVLLFRPTGLLGKPEVEKV